MTNILVTGGCGYIGSHICVELLKQNYKIIIIDNLINSSKNILMKIKQITNKSFDFHEIDITDMNKLNDIFCTYNINCIIHCAGLKSVTDSFVNPLEYYNTNVTGTLNILNCMKTYNCFNLIFSSSATVYGNIKSPLYETDNLCENITNTYGRTKYIAELAFEDLCNSDCRFTVIALRYFNPIGAHESGLLGDDPQGIPTNIMPYLSRVAVHNNTKYNLGKQYEYISIYGTDYNTPDGTCIRDYIHISDLVDGHIKAVEKINSFNAFTVINLGMSKGISVKELINTFIQQNNVNIPYIYKNRRDGDVAEVYCNCDKAFKLLNWKPEKTLSDMCIDSWKWQCMNPYGYE
jgi:UDP-glucose 4-epimerase